MSVYLKTPKRILSFSCACLLGSTVASIILEVHVSWMFTMYSAVVLFCKISRNEIEVNREHYLFKCWSKIDEGKSLIL